MVTTRTINLKSKGFCDTLDITPEVARLLAEANVSDGTVTLFINGSTAGLTTIEYEPGVIADFRDMWERTAPRNIPYQHDSRWGDGNGFSHVRASLLGASLVIPFTGGKLALGTWQQIVVVDFDNRERSRQVIMQIMGE